MSDELRRAGTDDEELRILARFLASVFHRSDLYVPAYLRWLYAENPAGAVFGVNAWQAGAIVGHYAVVPIEAESEGVARRAALSLNTAIHPAHQGRGLFTRLAEETYALAREGGVEEVLGVANASSAPGFLGRLGFNACGPLEARLLRRAPRPWVRADPPSWRRVWNPESLGWRVRNPRARYRVETREGFRSILAPTGWPGVRAVLRTEPAAGAVDLPELAPADRAPLRLWLGRRPDAAGPAPGGIAIPMRLRPSPLEVIHRALVAGARAPDPGRMHFEAIDFDAY